MLHMACFLACQVLSSPEMLTEETSSKQHGSVLSISPVLKVCISWMCNFKTLNWQMLRGRRSLHGDTLKLRYPFPFLDMMVDYLAEVWLTLFLLAAFACLCEKVQFLVEQLKSKTPAWSHLISATKYNSALAKKQLLGTAGRLQVAALIDQVETLKKDVADYFAKVVPNIAENVTIVEAEGVLESSKYTMLIIAAVNVIEHSQSPDAKSQASAILEDPATLPDVLKKKLRVIAHSST